jgi:uridine kinase
MNTSHTSQSLQNFLLEEILRKAELKKLFIVGISGLDASGKSQIAQTLTTELEKKGKSILSISGDSFQYPRGYKEDFQEETWAIQHIRRTINFEKMRNDFLIPLKQEPKSILIDIVNYDSKERVQKKIKLNYPLIVIIESIYLFQKSLIEFFDYTIFLDITPEESLNRVQSRPRDLELYGSLEGIEKKYTTKNYPGYQLFNQQENPKQYANVIIDNNDWEHPTLL